MVSQYEKISWPAGKEKQIQRKFLSFLGEH